MNKCRHKKRNDYEKWCYECGAKRAGPKPKPTFKVGWYAVTDDMEFPGRIGSVSMSLLGLGVEKQTWSEEVTIINNSETWRGPADHVTRLVADKYKS